MDEHEPMWEGSADGDMGSDTDKSPIILKPSDFPPGTKVVVSEPLCPKCGECFENCMVRGRPGDCDFDWKNWAEEQYS